MIYIYNSLSASVCENSPYKDEHHKHVVTGDLTIIQDKKLMKLFQKGPNYREGKSINLTRARKSVMEGLKEYIKIWSTKENKPESYFSEWKHIVVKELDEKIQQLKNTTLKRWRPKKEVLRDKDSIEALRNLQYKYAILPIDKTSNNVGFLCKYYFYKLMMEETRSETYEEVNIKKEDLIVLLTEKVEALNQKVSSEDKDLPIIYPTIKMHKNPIKFRYIVASKHCPTKQIAKKLTKILQLIQVITKRYCNKVLLFTGINRYWITDGTEQVLDDIARINEKKSAKEIETYDFSTLYTKIPLEDLKEKLKEVIAKAFKGGTNQYISINRSRASWTNKTKNTFTKEDIYDMIDIVIDNAYFVLGDKVYRQIVGFPMGVDPAPPGANLYLYYYESTYIEKLTKEDYGKAKRYNHTHRFIDDLNTMNNGGHLNQHKEEIYPKQLVLNKENDGNQSTTFLDLHIQVQDRRFITKTYDKRDDFPFQIINYPDISGNIAETPSYGIIASQTIRNARNCLLWIDLKERLKELCQKLIKKGYEVYRMKQTLKKCLHRHTWIATKYQKRTTDIIEEILDTHT